MSCAALWPYALDFYGRPGAEAVLLRLQDEQGQCVAYLLWALWAAKSGRTLEGETLIAGARLARAWQEAAVAPLRKLRRDLKSPGAPQSQRQRLRESVKRLELDAERMLLEMLEQMSPSPVGAPVAPATALARAARTWGPAAPAGPMLERLCQLAD